MLLHLALALALIGVPGMTDDLLARLERLESDNASLRGQVGALSMESVRSGRSKRDAMTAADANALLAPRSLARPIGFRTGTDTTPDLGTPLLARLRDDQSMPGTSGRVDAFDGYANMLPDPAFETAQGSITLTTAYQALGPQWEAKYVLNSGTVATTPLLYNASDRATYGQRGLSSGIVALQLSFGVNASDMTVYLRPSGLSQVAVTMGLDPSWLVASLRAWVYSLSGSTLSTATAYLEIVDSSDTVLASGDLTDLPSLYDIAEQARLDVGYDEAAPATDYRFRLRVDVVKSAGGAADIFVLMAEPLLAPSNDGSSPSFTPAIGSWVPGFPGYQLAQRLYVESNVAAGATTTLDIGSPGFAARIGEVWGGSIVGITYRWNAAVTGGTFTIRVQDGGSTIWTPISGATAQGDEVPSNPGSVTFVAGSELTVDVITTAGFLPAGTDDLVVELWLLYDFR